MFDNTAMGHATANAIWLEDAASSKPMLASAPTRMISGRQVEQCGWAALRTLRRIVLR